MRVPATRAILYEFGQLKMGVVLIKWAWPKIFARTLHALLLQPHHCNNPRSAPVTPPRSFSLGDQAVWTLHDTNAEAGRDD